MGTYGVIALDNITGSILSKVIEYCLMHTKAAAKADKLKKWDQAFVNIDLAILFDIIFVSPLSVCRLFFDVGKSSLFFLQLMSRLLFEACRLSEHQRLAGFDMTEGGTHDFREDDKGDA
ncbi:SKP1-like protein 4 [Linum grandiflorum]